MTADDLNSNEEKVVEGEPILDARTSQEIPRGANSLVLSSNQNTQIETAKVGTLELSDQAETVLSEKLKPEDVRIRPDGLVYVDWMYYADKLNRAFGKMKWGLIPQGAPHVKEDSKGDCLVVWGFWLIVKGVPISFAYGETTYRPSNKTMSYGDACEGAKSISLSRNCKALGVTLELWNPDYVTAWKKHFAEYVDNPNGDYPKKIWRKKVVKAATGYHNDEIQTPEPQDATEQPASTETTAVVSKNAPEPVSETNVPTYTGNQILGSHDGQLVKELVEMTHKTTADVCKVVGKLEKGKKFALAEVAAMIVVPSQAPEATGA